MLAVDVNVLIHANRAEMALHEVARERLRHLAEGDSRWGLPAPVVWGFLRIVTQAIFDPPTPMAQAVSFVDALLTSPSARLLTPGPRHWSLLALTNEESDVTGRLLTDAAIVAICRERAVDTVLSADRDFARFDQVTWEPLAG